MKWTDEVGRRVFAESGIGNRFIIFGCQLDSINSHLTQKSFVIGTPLITSKHRQRTQDRWVGWNQCDQIGRYF